MGLLGAADQERLRERFAGMTRPVRLLFFTQTLGCETCLQTRQILDELPLLSGQVTIEERSYDQGDALKLEIEAFLESIVRGTPPQVTGEDGLRALETAIRITELVQKGQ